MIKNLFKKSMKFIQIAQIKSKELAKIKFDKPFTKGDFEIKIIGDIKAINGGIELFATAFKNGKQVGFGKDGSVEIERFRIFNPRILTDDPNGDIIIKEENEKGEIRERRVKKDLEQATKNTLAYVIQKHGKDGKNIIKGKIGHTITVLYPTLNGRIGCQSASDWATVRGASAGTTGEYGDAVDTTATVLWGRDKSSPWQIVRNFLYWDTSVIAGEISSAVISLYNTYQFGDGYSNKYVVFVAATPAGDDALVTEDYDQRGSTKFSNNQAISSGETSPNEYKDFTLNASGLAGINQSGITTLAMLTGRDFDNVTAQVDSFWYYRTVNYDGTDTDPIMTVEHTIPSQPKSFAQII